MITVTKHHRFHIFLLVQIWFIASVAYGQASLSAQASPPRGKSEVRGVLSFGFENDILVGNDNHYTNGLGLHWTTAQVSALGEKNFFYRLNRLLSFLPGVDPSGRGNYLRMAISHEIYTPDDILAPAPPEGDHPYAGILRFDFNLFIKAPQSLQRLGFTTGLVGPASGAEQIQRRVHKWIGADIPQGWDTQLSNELLLGLNYQYHRRLVGQYRRQKISWDLSGHGGGGLGNYYTGVNAEALLRLGSNLPDTYGSFDNRSGGDALVGIDETTDRWRWYIFGGLGGYGVAKFLPTDGNTFKDSREGTRDPFSAAVSIGFFAGIKQIFFAYTLQSSISPSNPPGAHDDTYGNLTLATLF
jgi:hypothetical protein